MTITAEDKSKAYGAALPALTFTYAGLVNGDLTVAVKKKGLKAGVATVPTVPLYEATSVTPE